MKDSQKPDHVSLANMVGRLREGRYVIPDFQRDFEWEPWDIKELMRSIFRDYYIGSLLLWKGKDENFEALSCEAIYGFEGGDVRTDIVLDEGLRRYPCRRAMTCAETGGESKGRPKKRTPA